MFLDIGMGLIFSVLFTKLFSIPLTTSIIVISVTFSLLPDVDGIVDIIQRGKLSDEGDGFHRDFIHNPLFWAPFIVFAYVAYGIFWGSLFFANILSHFLHDSLGTGWGLKWLWPFSKDHFKFFADRYDRRRFTTTPIVRFKYAGLREHQLKYGDPDWFRTFYLRWPPHPWLLLELTGLIIGIAVLIANL